MFLILLCSTLRNETKMLEPTSIFLTMHTPCHWFSILCANSVSPIISHVGVVLCLKDAAIRYRCMNVSTWHAWPHRNWLAANCLMDCKTNLFVQLCPASKKKHQHRHPTTEHGQIKFSNPFFPVSYQVSLPYRRSEPVTSNRARIFFQGGCHQSRALYKSAGLTSVARSIASKKKTSQAGRSQKGDMIWMICQVVRYEIQAEKDFSLWWNART